MPTATSTQAIPAEKAPPERTESLERFSHVPIRISAEAKVTGLTVRELFRLEKGSIVTTLQSASANLPLYAGNKLFAWGEFQVSGERLAVRVGELA